MNALQTDFKQALSLWPSGVTLVTTFAHVANGQNGTADERPCGMTVSAFFSVSLSPLLIGVCLDNRSGTLTEILKSKRFAVNVLSQDQAHLSTRFATPGNEDQRFDRLPLLNVPQCNSPLVEGAVAILDCTLESARQTGDHTLCLGEPTWIQRTSQSPLVFQSSTYHQLAPRPTDKSDSDASSV